MFPFVNPKTPVISPFRKRKALEKGEATSVIEKPPVSAKKSRGFPEIFKRQATFYPFLMLSVNS